MRKRFIACCLLTVLWFGLVVTSRAAENRAAGAAAPTGQKPVSGKVIETMKAGQYTYLHVDDGKEKVWVATYATYNVAVGEEVRVGDYLVMENFKSKTLNRTFDTVFFAGQIEVAGRTNASVPELPPGHPNIQGGRGTKPAEAALPAGHPAIGQEKSPAPAVEKDSIKKIRGGYTVEECFAKRKSLAEKTIKVRGVVVKFTPGIMERNWIHLQDGTGNAGVNDLTVTTKETAEVGEVIVVTGKINYDRNFGAGYSFAAIVEDATINREGMYRR